MTYTAFMDCGHALGYMYRIRDADGELRKFCMACLFEKVGIKDVNGKLPYNKTRVPTLKTKKSVKNEIQSDSD